MLFFSGGGAVFHLRLGGGGWALPVSCDVATSSDFPFGFTPTPKNLPFPKALRTHFLKAFGPKDLSIKGVWAMLSLRVCQ